MSIINVDPVALTETIGELGTILLVAIGTTVLFILAVKGLLASRTKTQKTK